MDDGLEGFGQIKLLGSQGRLRQLGYFSWELSTKLPEYIGFVSGRLDKNDAKITSSPSSALYYSQSSDLLYEVHIR